MSRLRRYLVPAGLVILGGLLFWPPLFAHINANRAASYYRHQFAASQPSTIVLTHYEWAVTFGGHAGLKQLRALSGDQTLKPSGRTIALAVINFIERGNHVSELRKQLAGLGISDICGAPFTCEYLYYIYLHDSLIANKP